VYKGIRVIDNNMRRLDALPSLVGLVPDKSNNHAVEVKEEHDQMEAELDERLLLVDVQLAEDLGSIQQVGVLEDLLDVPGEQRKVQDQSQPISVNEEEEGQETVYRSLGDDVGVQAVAEVDWVDVVAIGAQSRH
jgi:hypothetical protein